MRDAVSATLLALCFATTGSAQAPPGFRTYENKLARLSFIYPSAYEELPMPPTEQVLVAKFLLKQWPGDLKSLGEVYRGVTPEIQTFVFDQVGPVTGAKSPEPAPPQKPTTVREAMESQNRVTTWTGFTARFREQWSLTEVPKKPGHFTMRFTGQWFDDRTQVRPVGYLVRFDQGNTTFGVYGHTLTPHQAAFEKQLLKVAGSLALTEGDSSDAAEQNLDRLYENSPLRSIPARKKARADLARGWKAVDTENYLIVHHSKSEGLIKQIAREIEAMRVLYSQHFPTPAPIEALSVVRVCRTREEYHQYGGPPSTGGYWHPGNEELVFFDYSYTMKTLDDDERKAMRGRVLTNDDSLLVLYHEALHQYMHYAVGEFAPHDWFNEGYGDYYSGAVISETTKSVTRIDPSPWRIHLAKDMCEYGDGFVPLERLLKAERGEFYNPARARHYYAAAWSFVYFLKASKEAAANPAWTRILPDYFETAKTTYRTEVAQLGAEPTLEAKMLAGAKARTAALRKVTDGLDLPQLETTWRKWVVDMRDPWPSKRQKRK